MHAAMMVFVSVRQVCILGGLAEGVGIRVGTGNESV